MIYTWELAKVFVVVGMASGDIIRAGMNTLDGNLEMLSTDRITTTEAPSLPANSTFTSRCVATLKLSRWDNSRGQDIVTIVTWSDGSRVSAGGSVWTVYSRCGHVVTSPVLSTRPLVALCGMRTAAAAVRIGGMAATCWVGAWSGGLVFFSIWDKQYSGIRDWSSFISVPLR